MKRTLFWVGAEQGQKFRTSKFPGRAAGPGPEPAVDVKKCPKIRAIVFAMAGPIDSFLCPCRILVGQTCAYRGKEGMAYILPRHSFESPTFYFKIGEKI